MEKYIYLLRNFSNLFRFPQAKHHQFQAYVDQLFSTLLNQNINIYIQSEVFYNIYMNYSITNGNRLRFEKYLRNPIIELGENIKTLNYLYNDINSNENLNTEEMTSESSLNQLSKTPPEIKYWKTQYYAIWNVWYMKPTNNEILLYDSSKLKTAGYALKRKEQLYKYVSQNSDGSLEAKLQIELPYNLNTQPSLLYFTNKKDEINLKAIHGSKGIQIYIYFKYFIKYKFIYLKNIFIMLFYLILFIIIMLLL